MKNSSISRRALLASTALFAIDSRAQVQTAANVINWPNRPIKIVVPGPAGVGGDIFARMLAGPLQEALKQSIVIENKAGANGIIGNDAVAKAHPDGYTFLFAPSSSIAINPILQPKMPYDSVKDLAPVAQIGLSGFLLVANPSTGFKNLDDMVRYAKANPGKLNYASWGNGSSGHLAMESIKAHYQIFMPHIPYKGVLPALTDLLANNISVGFVDIASPVPHIRSGRLVGLGCTGSSRGPALPDLPTLSQQGFKFDTDGWYGVFTSAGTPQSLINRMNQEINRILATDEVIQKFASNNMPKPPIKTADQFAATLKKDVETWQGLAKVAGLKID
jgi:tripartite-type tricarboxylate transporter receptor subunit TctC